MKNSKSLRRLAADHASLQTAGLPPNYLFPPSNSASDPFSDLTALDVLLAGPQGTPFSTGVWRLHLDIPPTYPTAPPTATFRTRIWHPNIDESTGAVCVETLKRDWSDKLKLRDVLVTISCLLIQPNPASALNGEAGKLASEDWEGFCRRAKLMTGIHAAVPKDLQEEVREAQSRGEDTEDKPVEKEKGKPKANSVKEEKGKGKEKVRAVEANTLETPLPKRRSKVTQEMAAEEEENIRGRGQTAEPESDTESDWIPGPIKTPQPFGRDNIFGIRVGTPALEDPSIQFDTGPSRITSPPKRPSQQKENDENPHDISDPFITVPLKRTTAPTSSFTLPLPPTPTSKHPSPPRPLISHKFSDRNPFAAISTSAAKLQPNLMVQEFSFSWQDSQILHQTGTITDGPTRQEVLKRMRGEEWDERRRWEVKRLRKAGGDLGTYNRGVWGARIGLGRL